MIWPCHFLTCSCPPPLGPHPPAGFPSILPPHSDSLTAILHQIQSGRLPQHLTRKRPHSLPRNSPHSNCIYFPQPPRANHSRPDGTFLGAQRTRALHTCLWTCGGVFIPVGSFSPSIVKASGASEAGNFGIYRLKLSLKNNQRSSLTQQTTIPTPWVHQHRNYEFTARQK